MIDLFRGCQFPKISSRHLLTASRYCYLWQRIDDAVHFLSSIFDAYFTLGTADDHFVYIRGLPFFGETWSYYLCYSILSGDLHEIEGFTRRAKAKSPPALPRLLEDSRLQPQDSGASDESDYR